MLDLVILQKLAVEYMMGGWKAGRGPRAANPAPSLPPCSFQTAVGLFSHSCEVMIKIKNKKQAFTATSLNCNGDRTYQMMSMNSGICKTSFGEKVFVKVKEMEADVKEMAKLLKASQTG